MRATISRHFVGELPKHAALLTNRPRLLGTKCNAGRIGRLSRSEQAALLRIQTSLRTTREQGECVVEFGQAVGLKPKPAEWMHSRSWAGFIATTPSQSNDQESQGLDRIRARKACPVIDTSAGASHFQPAGSTRRIRGGGAESDPAYLPSPRERLALVRTLHSVSRAGFRLPHSKVIRGMRSFRWVSDVVAQLETG